MTYDFVGQSSQFVLNFVFWPRGVWLAVGRQTPVLAKPPEDPREGSQGNQRFEQAPARLAIFFVGVNTKLKTKFRVTHNASFPQLSGSSVNSLCDIEALPKCKFGLYMIHHVLPLL